MARSFLRRQQAQPFQLVISNGLYGWPLSFRHLDILMIQIYHLTMAGLSRNGLIFRGDRLTTLTVAAFFDRLARHEREYGCRTLRASTTHWSSSIPSDLP